MTWTDLHPNLWFAWPWTLVALTSILLLLLQWWRLARWRREALRLFAQLGTQRRLLRIHPRLRFWKRMCIALGWFLLIVACAGPRWGRDFESTAHPQGDLVLCLDLSRSMNAQQPSRRELALRAANDLVGSYTKQGGPRLALVGFAARAQLLVPLTTDYGHVQMVLERIAAGEETALVPEANDAVVSGTRFGQALRFALSVLEDKSAGTLLLLSDGDDPVDDEEWLQGVQEASSRKRQVHVLSVGDSDQEYAIPHLGAYYRFQGQVVKTRTNEARLREIARRTGGGFFSGGGRAFPLGSVGARLVPTDVADGEDPGLPVFRQRYVWFLLPASLLFLLSLGLNEGPRENGMVRPASNGDRSSAATMVTGLLLALVSLSADEAPSVRQALRQGNTAYAQGDWEGALRWYAKAESQTNDPGLVSLNRAAAHQRLGQFREAEMHYRLALEDDQAAPKRQARAWFELGNVLVRQSGAKDARLLDSALDAYRECLQVADSELAADARHNLETVRLLWLTLRKNEPDTPPEADPPRQDPRKPNLSQGAGGDPNGVRPGDAEGEPGDPSDPGPDAKNGNAKKLSGGPLRVLPDQDPLRPLTPQEIEAHLQRLLQRLQNQRTTPQNSGAAPTPHFKDW